MTRSIYATADKWIQPTVGHVHDMLKKASEKIGCSIYDIHLYLGASERTVRRWKTNYQTSPDEVSSIRYPSWGLLVKLVDGRLIFTKDGKPLEVHNQALFGIITDKYLLNAIEFKKSPPPRKVASFFVGEDSITNLSRMELAGLLSYDSSQMGRLINNMQFSVWASLLVIYGVDETKLFY